MTRRRHALALVAVVLAATVAILGLSATGAQAIEAPQHLAQVSACDNLDVTEVFTTGTNCVANLEMESLDVGIQRDYALLLPAWRWNPQLHYHNRYATLVDFGAMLNFFAQIMLLIGELLWKITLSVTRFGLTASLFRPLLHVADEGFWAAGSALFSAGIPYIVAVGAVLVASFRVVKGQLAQALSIVMTTSIVIASMVGLTKAAEASVLERDPTLGNTLSSIEFGLSDTDYEVSRLARISPGSLARTITDVADGMSASIGAHMGGFATGLSSRHDDQPQPFSCEAYTNVLESQFILRATGRFPGTSPTSPGIRDINVLLGINSNAADEVQGSNFFNGGTGDGLVTDLQSMEPLDRVMFLRELFPDSYRSKLNSAAGHFDGSRRPSTPLVQGISRAASAGVAPEDLDPSLRDYIRSAPAQNMVLLNELWKQAYFSLWYQAALGGQTTVTSRVGCHIAEVDAEIPALAQQHIAALAGYPTISFKEGPDGHARPATPGEAGSERATGHTSLYAELGDNSILVQNLGWAACVPNVNAGTSGEPWEQWSMRPEFDQDREEPPTPYPGPGDDANIGRYIQYDADDKHALIDPNWCAAWYSGYVTQPLECQGLSCNAIFNFLTAPFRIAVDLAVRAFNSAVEIVGFLVDPNILDISLGSDPSYLAPIKEAFPEAGDFMAAIEGHNRADRLLASFASIMSGFIIGKALGSIALGAVLAQLLSILALILMPVSLTFLMVDTMRGTEVSRGLGMKALRMTAALLFSKVMFVIALTTLVAFTSITVLATNLLLT